MLIRRKRRSVLLILSLLMLAAQAARAQGGPPLLTDDPGTPGNRRWEINVGFTFDRNRAATVFETPRVDFNYGLSDHIQLKYELPWVVVNPNDQRRRNGLGNSLMGVKWRFIDEEKRRVSISIYPQLEFNNPTSSADRGLVERGTQFLLPIEMARRLGPFDMNWEVGYKFRKHEMDEWVYGLAFGHRLSPRLELLGELHGTVQRDLGEDQMVFDLGGRWRLRGPLVFLFTTGRALRGLSDERPTWFGYVGMQFNF
ncbi:MAG: hypothetical protein HY237_14695 [Acidobacteria bacterium]|nr:hypothetical protein [Acidobacteriota bacterium]